MLKPGNFSTHHNASKSAGAPARAGQRIVYNRDGHTWTFRWDDGSLPQLLSALADLADRADVPFDQLDASIVTSILHQEAASASGPIVLPPAARAG
jgi:hypothetical protein